MNNPYAMQKPTIEEFTFDQLDDIEANIQSDETFKNNLTNYLDSLKQSHKNKLNQGLSSEEFTKHSSWINAIDSAINIVNKTKLCQQ